MIGLGKLPARENAVTFKYRDFANLSVLPSPPSGDFGHIKLFPRDGWGMLGNDKAGCCVWSMQDHTELVFDKLGGGSVSFTAADTIADYSRVTGYNPNFPFNIVTDHGTDMQVAAEYWRTRGLLGADGLRHRCDAYVAIKLKDEDEFMSSLYNFDALEVGVLLQKAQTDQFAAGQPWTVATGSPIAGGHGVPCFGRTDGMLDLVTWGRAQPATWSYLAEQADEIICVLSHASFQNKKNARGFDWQKMQDMIAALPKAA
jgi:hypothetical protein